MQYYMVLFGSGMNFYSGPGESHHRHFFKFPGDNTQRRVSEFAKQIANRIYENMLLEIVKTTVTNFEESEFVNVTDLASHDEDRASDNFSTSDGLNFSQGSYPHTDCSQRDDGDGDVLDNDSISDGENIPRRNTDSTSSHCSADVNIGDELSERDEDDGNEPSTTAQYSPAGMYKLLIETTNGHDGKSSVKWKTANKQSQPIVTLT